MPSVCSGYTFADFIARLERSPVTHMSPLYHEHRDLFAQRSDLFAKAVLSISWPRGVALVQAAYYAQPVSAGVYRALLARMLLHNQHVARTHAGVPVPWQSALRVFDEAAHTHGGYASPRLVVSTLRLLAPQRRWREAMRVLQYAQANGQLTLTMLTDAARVCATPAAWQKALWLLAHVHAQQPARLYDAIQSMRPPGTNAFTSAQAAHALLTTTTTSDSSSSSSSGSAGPTREQQHILRILGDVVAAVPPSVAQQHPLCRSYVTHLIASTTLSVDAKVRALTRVLQPLPWRDALSLLHVYAEPVLLSDDEWQHVQHEQQKQQKRAAAGATRRARAAQSARRRVKRRAAAPSASHRHRPRRRRGRRSSSTVPSAVAAAEATVTSSSAVASECTAAAATAAAAVTATTRTSSSEDASTTVPTTAAVDVTVVQAHALVPLLQQRLRWLRGAPATVAALMAVLIDKLPDIDSAMRFVRDSVAALQEEQQQQQQQQDVSNSSVRSVSSSEATKMARHPVVLHALLRKCVADANAAHGAHVAATLLLSQFGAHVASPTDVLSTIVRRLRRQRAASLVVRVLHEHVVPTHSTLTPRALHALLECVLAHNRAVHTLATADLTRRLAAASAAATATATATGAQSNVAATTTTTSSPPQSSSCALQPHGTPVHWQSALRWSLDLRAPAREERIVRTGTGPSSGAHSPRPVAETTALDKPLDVAVLNVLLRICVEGGSAAGALRALAHARRADKTELALAEELRALLFCVTYDRPHEAEALVRGAEQRRGVHVARPLRQLLELARAAKQRQALEARWRVHTTRSDDAEDEAVA